MIICQKILWLDFQKQFTFVLWINSSYQFLRIPHNFFGILSKRFYSPNISQIYFVQLFYTVCIFLDRYRNSFNNSFQFTAINLLSVLLDVFNLIVIYVQIDIDLEILQRRKWLAKYTMNWMSIWCDTMTSFDIIAFIGWNMSSESEYEHQQQHTSAPIVFHFT